MKIQKGYFNVDSALFIGVTLMIGGFLSYIGILIYEDYTSPVFTLRKDEWNCTRTETHVTLQPTIINGTVIQTPLPHVECIEYQRQ